MCATTARLFLFLLLFSIYIYLCLCVLIHTHMHVHTSGHACGGWKTTCVNLFSPSPPCTGTELKPSWLQTAPRPGSHPGCRQHLALGAVSHLASVCFASGCHAAARAGRELQPSLLGEHATSYWAWALLPVPPVGGPEGPGPAHVL